MEGENTPKKIVLIVGETRIECEPSNIVMMTNKHTDGFQRTVTAILGTIESVDNESKVISVRFGDDKVAIGLGLCEGRAIELQKFK